MALTDKNIVITPNIGSASDPQIVFSGADASTGPQNITVKAYPQNNGTLSFEGSAGQLFSITNSLTGTIFSVNDISGIPSIEVLDTGAIRLAPFGGNVTLGSTTAGTLAVPYTTASTSTTSGALTVTGGVGVGGAIYAGSLQNTPIGGTTRSTGAFTTLTANNAVTFTQNTASTNTTSGTLVVTGGLGVSGDIYAGGIQSTPIGATARSTGAFTSLAANAAVTFTQNTSSTTTGTGTLVVTGGVGVSENINAGGNVVSSLSVNSGVVIRGGGASAEGGQISIGYGNNTATTITGQANNTWNLDVAAGTANNDFRIFRQNGSGTVATVVQIDEATGRFSLPLNITSSSTTTGTLVVGGGVGVAGRISTTDLTVTNTITGSVSGNAGTVTNGFYTTSTFNLGTTSIAVNRASAAQSLTGISIDGNAGTVTNGVYTTGDQTIGGIKTFSSRIVASQSAAVGSNGVDLTAAGSGYLRGTANDNATSTLANVQLQSWFGIGFGPSITGQTVPSGENAVWINARTGELSARNNITAYSSDERLKLNFEVIPDALEKIQSINGYTFDWDVELCRSLGFEPSQLHEHGVKAQEIQKVVPDAVSLAPFDVDRDENGNVVSRSGKDYLTVRYERLVPLLIESIKELVARVKELESK